MRVCDAETTQRIGRCILEFKRELDRSDREESDSKSNKIGGNDMFSAQSAAEKHRRELQMLRSSLKKGDSSARVAQYNNQCDEDKNKYTSGQVLEPEVDKTLMNDESTRTNSIAPTSFEHTTCSYQHNVHPFRGNPRECNGYPPPYVKNEPKHELNFFLTQLEGGNKQNENTAENKTTEQKKKKRGSIFKKMSSGSKKLLQEQKAKEEQVELENGLACSIVSREPLSFEKLKKQVSSPESGKFKTKPVIILCHGAMSWRNQMLLANLSAELVAVLDVHILRFDFTGNGHSKGEWRFGNFTTESEDLSKVIDFVKNSLQCQVGCVIGHSQGAASVLNYASHIANQEIGGEKEDVNPKCFVNLAGRYRVPGWDLLTPFGQERQVEVMKNGFFTVNSEWGEDERIFKITEEALGAYKFQKAADTAKVIFPLRRDSSVRVLTIHGYEDEVVPVHDAFRFDEEIANHNLHVIKQADHNFNGLKYIDEMVLKIAIHYKSVNGDK